MRGQEGGLHPMAWCFMFPSEFPPFLSPTLHHAHIEEHIAHNVLPMYSQATAGYGWGPFVNTLMTRPSKAPLTGAQSITLFE